MGVHWQPTRGRWAPSTLVLLMLWVGLHHYLSKWVDTVGHLLCASVHYQPMGGTWALTTPLLPLLWGVLHCHMPHWVGMVGHRAYPGAP